MNMHAWDQVLDPAIACHDQGAAAFTPPQLLVVHIRPPSWLLPQ